MALTPKEISQQMREADKIRDMKAFEDWGKERGEMIAGWNGELARAEKYSPARFIGLRKVPPLILDRIRSWNQLDRPATGAAKKREPFSR